VASVASLRHVTLGQYYPENSPVHRLDPRSKIIGLLLLTVAVVLASSWAETAALLAGIGIVILLARLPWRHLWEALRPVWPLLVILGCFQLLFEGGQTAAGGDGALLRLGTYTLTAGRLLDVAASLGTLLNLILLVTLLTSTTTATALSSGLEMLLRPLNTLGLPGHELALMGCIALRFVPILGEELEALNRAQISRGAAWGATGRWHLVQNAQRTAALVVPLFADAFRRVEEMTAAMLARCYQGGRGRTYYVHRRLARADYVATGFSVAALVAVVIAH